MTLSVIEIKTLKILILPGEESDFCRDKFLFHHFTKKTLKCLPATQPSPPSPPPSNPRGKNNKEETLTVPSAGHFPGWQRCHNDENDFGFRLTTELPWPTKYFRIRLFKLINSESLM